MTTTFQPNIRAALPTTASTGDICDALLTTEHPTSSYGLPVVVIEKIEPIGPTAYDAAGRIIFGPVQRTYRALGPGEVLYILPINDFALPLSSPIFEAARAAGYQVARPVAG